MAKGPAGKNAVTTSGEGGKQSSGGAATKRRKQGSEAGMSEEEALRRKKQKELQQLAMKMRAAGKEYNPHKAKARVFRDVNRDVQPRPSQQKAASGGEPAARVSRKPRADFQVAIVPIFWNQNPAQKKMVLAKCGAAQEVLAAADITSHIDDGSHHTPGQKMRHWEEKGVKVRLEIGPKDAEQGTCVIARSQPEPGQVAHKVAGEIAPTLPAAVRALLDMRDEDVPAGDWSKYERADGQKGAVPSRAAGGAAGQATGGVKRKASTSAAESAEARAAAPASTAAGEDGSEDNAADDEEDGDVAEAEAQPRRAGRESGDMLEDDFGEDLQVEDVPDALSAADKQRLRKRAKSGLLKKKIPVSSDAAAETKAKPKAKKLKVVKF